MEQTRMSQKLSQEVELEYIDAESWPQGYRTFLCSTQLSMKF